MSEINFPIDEISFIGLNPNKNDQSKVARVGKELWNLLFSRERDFGGFFVEINGLMGSGKTSLMLGMADKILRTYPKETVFWREPLANPTQFTKIGGKHKWQVLHPPKICGTTLPSSSVSCQDTLFQI